MSAHHTMDKDTRNERNEGFSSNQRLIGGTDIPIPIWRIRGIIIRNDIWGRYFRYVFNRQLAQGMSATNLKALKSSLKIIKQALTEEIGAHDLS